VFVGGGITSCSIHELALNNTKRREK